MLAYDYPLMGLFLTIGFLFFWVAWIFIVIWVFIDNFRRDDRSGWAKAVWTIVIVFLPVLGVFLYISRPPDHSTL
jgi:hypothetical protein